jgi:dipeptidyl aminopeptidase/acylaminoacyl peptidase
MARELRGRAGSGELGPRPRQHAGNQSRSDRGHRRIRGSQSRGSARDRVGTKRKWRRRIIGGGTPEQVPANYVAASPIDHVSPGDPPMFLVQGRQDPLIPESQSVQMEEALESAGVTTRLVRVNGGHDLDFPEHYANLIHQILEFLNATWKDG